MLASAESAPTAPSRSMAKEQVKPVGKPTNTEEIPGQAERLKRLRVSHGYPTATAFAAFLDIGVTRYSAFENGSPISRDVVFRLVQKIPGLTSDWLYFDKADGLPMELARRLGVFDPPGKRNTA